MSTPFQPSFSHYFRLPGLEIVPSPSNFGSSFSVSSLGNRTSLLPQINHPKSLPEAGYQALFQLALLKMEVDEKSKLHEKTIKMYQQRLEEKQKIFEDFVSRMVESEKDAERILTVERDAAKAEHSAIRVRLDEANEELDIVTQELEAATEDLLATKNNLEEAHASVSMERQRVAELSESVKKAEQDRDVHHRNALKATHDLGALQTRLHALNSIHEQTLADANAGRQALSKEEVAQNLLLDKVTRLAEERASLIAALVAARVELKTAKEAFTDAEEQATNDRLTSFDLQNSLESVIAELFVNKNALSTAEEKIEDERMVNTGLRASSYIAEDKNRELSSELLEMDLYLEKLAALDPSCQTKDESLSAAEKALESERKAKEDHLRLLNEAREEIAKLKESVQNRDDQITSLAEQVVEQSLRQSTPSQDLMNCGTPEDFRATISSLTERNRSLKQSRIDMEEALMVKVFQCDELEQENRSLHQSIADFQSKHDKKVFEGLSTSSTPFGNISNLAVRINRFSFPSKKTLKNTMPILSKENQITDPFALHS